MTGDNYMTERLDEEHDEEKTNESSEEEEEEDEEEKTSESSEEEEEEDEESEDKSDEETDEDGWEEWDEEDWEYSTEMDDEEVDDDEEEGSITDEEVVDGNCKDTSALHPYLVQKYDDIREEGEDRLHDEPATDNSDTYPSPVQSYDYFFDGTPVQGHASACPYPAQCHYSGLYSDPKEPN